MTQDERDDLMEVANMIDEAVRECSFVAIATPSLKRCRVRASAAKIHLLKAERILVAMGVPIVQNPEGMI